MKTFKDEALEIIKELYDAINWLGGDAYEMECTQGERDRAAEFLEKHK